MPPKRVTRKTPESQGDETGQVQSDSSIPSPVRSGAYNTTVHTPLTSNVTGGQSTSGSQLPGSFAQNLFQENTTRSDSMILPPVAPGGSQETSVTFLASQMCQAFQQQMTIFMENFLRTQQQATGLVNQVRDQQQQQFLQDLRATQDIERQIALDRIMP